MGVLSLYALRLACDSPAPSAGTGIGIAAEDLDRVRTRFAQVDSAHSRKYQARKYQGTGLGRPIGKALAELHGGRFTMNPEPGDGTTVTVRFPAERIVQWQSCKRGTGTTSR